MMLAYYLIYSSVIWLQAFALNSTYLNPLLPGFYPDPSCIFVPEWQNTFFCASSSFLVFPGLPINASKDLQQWKLVSNAISRPEQLPNLALINSPSGGIWAPTLRYHEDTFHLVTTLVHADLPVNDSMQWDNFIMISKNPYSSSSWSAPIHFKFNGYDPSLFWDDNHHLYLTGAHPWQLQPGIDQASINIKTGEVGPIINIWNGTGALAPEGPHIYKRDGYYYLMIAEGGTGPNHQVSMARSRHINGPYKANPANPVLTNANTTSYF